MMIALQGVLWKTTSALFCPKLSPTSGSSKKEYLFEGFYSREISKLGDPLKSEQIHISLDFQMDEAQSAQVAPLTHRSQAANLQWTKQD